MTKEEEKYTTLDTDQCKWWVNTLFNIAKEKACNSHNFDDGEEMQAAQDKIINALEMVEEFEKAQIITGGRLNGRTYAYKCGLEDGKRKALEQHTSDDCVSRAEVLNLVRLNAFHVKSQLKAIENMPPVTPTQRWIPVSEELPKKNMPCLVSVGDFNLTQIAIYSNLMYTIDHKIFYQGDYGHDSFRDITKYVKAWMPLPKPYEEKRGSEDGSN